MLENVYIGYQQHIDGNAVTNERMNNERGSSMTPNLNNSENLFVANLQQVSLEKLVKSKLEVLFQQQKEAQVELNGLYNIVLEQVERPLIELALKAYNGNQVKTALMLGINRNTLKKKIDNYKLKPKKGAAAQATVMVTPSVESAPVLTQ
jgi:Fis family transcriptional regulator, factor for inversion stimulation protein